MSDFFKEWRRAIGMLTLMFALLVSFIFVVFLEAGIRTLQRKPIAVIVENQVNADVTGYVQPDFLWAGHEWFVTVTSKTPVSIEFDHQWKASLSSGNHTIYHNHDSNNTTKYAANRWYKTPTIIIVGKP